MKMVEDTRTDTENCNLSAEAMMEKQLQPPLGFRFEPMDEELVGYYLRSKIYDPTFSCPAIDEAPVYDSQPEELIRNYGRNKWSHCGYFFSHQKRRNPNHIRPDRSAGQGVWKTTGKDEEVKLSISNVIIGYRRSFVFYNGKPGPSTKTKWQMKEYVVKTKSDTIYDNKDEQANKSPEWMLCKIYDLTHKRGRDEGEYEDVILAESPQQKRRLEEVKEHWDEPYSKEDDHLDPCNILTVVSGESEEYEEVIPAEPLQQKRRVEEVTQQLAAPESEEDDQLLQYNISTVVSRETKLVFPIVIDDADCSASLRDTPALENPLLGKALGKSLLGKAKGKRSQRKRRQNKQETAQTRSKETNQDIEDINLKLNRIDPIKGVTISNDLGAGNRSISSWLEIDDDDLEDDDLVDLATPADDLSEIEKLFPL